MGKKAPKVPPKKPPSKTDAVKIVCENRKARHDYHVEDRLEAGLALSGSEVKSLRKGGANLMNAYADVRGGEAYLLQAHIAPYESGGYANHDPIRRRKLLLHRAEIDRITGKIQAKGMTLVPLKLYFKNGMAKVEIALATGKKTHDKRADIRKRETDRDLRRALISRRA